MLNFVKPSPSCSGTIRVCYLVREFPHSSESFVAYSFVSVAERTPACLLALKRTADPCGHPVLEHRAFKNLYFAERYRNSISKLLRQPRILLSQGLVGDSVIAARHLGYRTMARAVRSVSQCLAAITAFEPDIIHGEFVGMSQLANIVSRELDIPYTLMVHGSDVRRSRRFEQEDRALRSADAVFCTNQELREILVHRIGVTRGRVFVEPCAVDTEIFKPEGEVRARHFVTVGRLHPVKGIDILLQAAALLRGRKIEFSLDIVGDGPERVNLERQHRALGLETCVRFLGVQSHATLASILAQSSLLVMPSRDEGLPCAALEAMACSTPVLATRVGGLTDLINDDVGFLCAQDDPVALATAIELAIANQEVLRQKGAQARQKVQRDYGWDARSDRLISLWEQCVNS